MCTIAAKDHWISKNKEPGRLELNIPLLTDPSYPEWSLILLAPRPEDIDLKKEVENAISEGRYQKIDVEQKPEGKFHDIIVTVPKKTLPLSPFLIPVIVNKGEEPSINMISRDNFSKSWAGFGKIACVSANIHHRDRKDYLSQGLIISEVVNMGLTDAIKRIKELHKKYNLAGSNLMLANQREMYVVEYLYEKISARKVKDFAIRSNFSPKFRYWNFNWTPDKDPSRFHKVIRFLNRYLRGYQKLSSMKGDLTFEKWREIMSDHGLYSGIINRHEKMYDLLVNGKTEEALSSLKKLVESPGYYTICTHPSEVGKEFNTNITIFNFTADLINREVQVFFGNPCLREIVLKMKL